MQNTDLYGVPCYSVDRKASYCEYAFRDTGCGGGICCNSNSGARRAHAGNVEGADVKKEEMFSQRMRPIHLIYDLNGCCEGLIWIDGYQL